MTWPILALINIVTSAVVVLLQRVLMKEEDSNPVGSSIIFQFGLGIIALLFAVVLGRFSLPAISTHPELVFPYLLATLLWTGYTLFSFKASKLVGAGEMTILGASNSIITIFLSILFLSESLKITTIFGSALILFAIWLVNSEKLSFSSREGVIFALISAACGGIAVVVDATILKSYDAFSYLAVMSFLPGIVLLSSFPKQALKIPSLLKPKPLSFMLFFCFIYTIQSSSYYLAYQAGAPMSQLTPLSKSYIVLTLVLAVIFLKEKSNLKKKIVASVLVTIGAILLS